MRCCSFTLTRACLPARRRRSTTRYRMAPALAGSESPSPSRLGYFAFPRRMGRSKTELFLDQVARVASAVFEEVMAVQRYGGTAASIATIYETPHDDQAPVFGVARALEHARERCFVLAVDYPLITTEIL